MIIRKAKPEEYSSIAPLLLLAMEDIAYQFVGERSKNKAILFLGNLVQQKGNQYSYENCWVVEIEGKIIGVACVYDGGLLEELRAPVAKEIKLLFNKSFNPENETQAGEFYVDCVGIDAEHQGKGLGTHIFRFLIDEYVCQRNQTLGLLVDEENPGAKKLYLKLGFKIVGKKTLVGKSLEHLQIKSSVTE